MPAYKRSTGMVFQSYALFPHMTAAQNIGFGLEMRGLDAAERRAKVEEVLKLVRLSHLADRLPREMSGGQQQRVALARALVINPKLFLLDEPLSNLDAKLRAEVRIEIRSLQQRLGLTTLMVTHDREEALTMADRLVVMEGGRVRQIGSPRELYDAPQDAFVADFVGRCNILLGRRENDTQFRTANGLLLSVDTAANESKDATAFALRPERIAITPGAQWRHQRPCDGRDLSRTAHGISGPRRRGVAGGGAADAGCGRAARHAQGRRHRFIAVGPTSPTTCSPDILNREVIMISRRHFLSASAGAATALTSNFSPASAQSGQLVVGTWGGDYGQLLSDIVDKPLIAPKGIEVVQDVANADPRKTKLLAERQSRRGSMDVACLSDSDAYIVAGTNAFEAIDAGKVSRLGKVFPELTTETAIPHIYSAQVILYNTNKVTAPPQSYADLWDPKWRGRIGLADILWSANTIAAALAGGGSPTNFDPAEKMLMDWRSLDVKIYPSNEALAAALKSEEVWLSVDVARPRLHVEEVRHSALPRRAEGRHARDRVRGLGTAQCAQQGRRLHLSRRDARSEGAGRLRRQDGLCADGERRRAAGGHRPAGQPQRGRPKQAGEA